MFFIAMIHLFMSAWAASGNQELSYTIRLNGKKVGERTVVIRYTAPSEFQPQGGKTIESWTEIDATIAGMPQKYRNRVTAQLSPTSHQFVSVIGLNDDSLELQGRRLSSGRWMVSEITTDGLQRSEYRPSELTNVSLSLFDPEQMASWWNGREQGIFLTEAGERWVGQWSEGTEVDINRNGETVIGNRYVFKGDKGDLVAIWDSNGNLLDWESKIMGVKVEGHITRFPDAPDFGRIDVLPSFGTVQEKEL
ncbi:MAG: hypothetical protein VXZ96_09365 [Myxococcota bacterium]|nr:hypothetical protein [Myxococcota bacterium]